MTPVGLEPNGGRTRCGDISGLAGGFPFARTRAFRNPSPPIGFQRFADFPKSDSTARTLPRSAGDFRAPPKPTMPGRGKT